MLWLAGLLFMLALATSLMPDWRGLRKRPPRSRKRGARTGKPLWLSLLLLLLGALLLLAATTQQAGAANTVPLKQIYNGRLLNADGTAVTTAQKIRFSYWGTLDAVPADLEPDGDIDVYAANYAGWQEEHTVTPDSKGRFTVTLGSITPLPPLRTMPLATMLNLSLQVEVKPDGTPNTRYEILDPNSTSTTIDRSALLSVPFARNADLLDQRDVGTASGSIAVLGPGGRFGSSQIPGATDLSLFVIDFDGSSDVPTLQFGGPVGEQLAYDETIGRFRFSDDLIVQGNLYVEGTINGVDITSLIAPEAQLLTASGGGLDVDISAGNYRINGDVTEFAGNDVTLPDDAESYLFFDNGGLQVSQIGFPDAKSFIPLAVVTTQDGSVTDVNDKRVLFSDDREQTVEQVFHPEYASASYEPDGNDNVGQLTVGHDDATDRNLYRWTSTKSQIQDYDVVIRLTLPSTFARFTDTPLSVEFRSTTSDPLNSHLDISMTDATGAGVTLNGGATNLAATNWTTANLTFGGTPVWTPGGDIEVRLRLSAKDLQSMEISRIRLQYVELR